MTTSDRLALRWPDPYRHGARDLIVLDGAACAWIMPYAADPNRWVAGASVGAASFGGVLVDDEDEAKRAAEAALRSALSAHEWLLVLRDHRSS